MTTNPRNLTLLLLLLSYCIFFLPSCEPEVDTPEPSAGMADFSRYIALGNFFSSGFADGALSKQGQLASFPNILAQQMKLVDGADTFNIPLLKGDKGTFPDDSYGPAHYNLTLPRFILEKDTSCDGEIEILPERMDTIGDDEINLSDETQRIYEIGKNMHHLGIPAMKSFHVNSPGYANVGNYGTPRAFNPYFWRFAPDPVNSSTVFFVAVTARPTFFTMELGMSDVLSYAIDGGIGIVDGSADEDITSVSRFEAALGQILDTLINRGATGLIATVPDVTTFPYFTTIEYDALDLTAGKADTMNDMYESNPNIGRIFHEGEHNPFVIKEDGVVRVINSDEFVLLGIDVDLLKCLDLGAYEPIGDEYILSKEEIENVVQYIANYNRIIKALAAERQQHLAIVDLAKFIDRIYQETTIDGIDLTAEFASGGFFSLDGLTPNDRGQALIANEFIKVINKEFGAKLPLINSTQYRGVLFP